MTDQAPKPCGAAPRVLLVEDNEAAGRGLAKLLEAYGFRVTTVSDGSSALGALNGGPPPDFVLTDMQLPDLDGREVALQARQLDPRPKIALITGWDVDLADVDRSTWGIDWVLIKPVDIQDLLAKLREPADPAG